MKTDKKSFCFVRWVMGAALISVASVFSTSLIHAAVLITETDGENVETHIFADGVYYNTLDDEFLGSFNLAKNRCLRINHESQRYFVGGCDEMINASQEVMLEFYERSKEELAKLGGDYSAMINLQQQMAAQANTKTLSVKALGKDTHLGVPVERYELKSEGKTVKEIWVAPTLLKMIEKEFDLVRFKEMTNAYKDSIDEATFLELNDPMSRQMEKLAEKGYLVKVLPVIADEDYFSMAMTGNASMLLRTEVVTIETKSNYDIASLVAPKSYQKSASWKEFIAYEMSEDEDYDD